MGVLCLHHGRPSVVEYSELSAELSAASDFSAAHLCMNLFRLDFLRRVANVSLMHHLVKRKASCFVDGKPAEVLAKKYEAFLFDAFAYAQNFWAFEVDRALEFSPIKNAHGEDSPETALADLVLFNKQE